MGSNGVVIGPEGPSTACDGPLPRTGRGGIGTLLVVLAVEEARDVDRLALVAGLVPVLVDLRLGRAARDVRHALEQGPTGGRRLIFRRGFLIGRRRDRRLPDRSGEYVVGIEQQFLAVAIVALG